MQNFSGMLEQRVQEVLLPNGLHFLVLQRTKAPIVSCHTHANVGAFDEVAGQTGDERAAQMPNVCVVLLLVEQHIPFATLAMSSMIWMCSNTTLQPSRSLMQSLSWTSSCREGVSMRANVQLSAFNEPAR